ncbi:hypothetical protein [uncultured Chryseobacterium sp.]|jgi:hypothetical protein|uniref:hypothetical protein n=1 Tax=uncultured Chryseobacterium sp. TaxID=259322 RepID=UPI00260C86CB|nr:hypothetical protein [uncultured Chryseobacterium sp.]
MKKVILPLFCILMGVTSVTAQKKTAAPAKIETQNAKLSAKDVIDTYIKALGGKDKLEAVKTTIIHNTLSVQGMEISMVTKKLGNKFRSEQEVMGQKMVQFFDGEKGYIEQMGQKIDIPATEIDDLKKAKVIDALGYDPAKFSEVNVEKVDGKDYNVLTSEQGKSYFDKSTGLLHKTISEDNKIFINNYVTVEGIKFPSEVEAEGNGQKVLIKTTKVIINSGVSEEDFK